jgi:hypothetical protein
MFFIALLEDKNHVEQGSFFSISSRRENLECIPNPLKPIFTRVSFSRIDVMPDVTVRLQHGVCGHELKDRV